jgi:hypothetical protein
MTDEGTKRVHTSISAPEATMNRWDERAGELDMSRSEYIRTMVEAGDKNLSIASPLDSIAADKSLKNRVLDLLEEDEYKDWDTVLRELTEEMERELEEILNELLDEGRIDFSPRQGWKK